MNPHEFKRSSAGEVIRVGAGDASYYAFAPAPLPPPIKFDAPLLLALSDADRALGELSGLGMTIPNPHLFIRPFIRREAVLSSRIEGTQADIADLYAYEAGQLTLPGLKTSEADVREVKNYVTALEYGLEELTSFPLSLRLLRNIHKVLMTGVRGSYAAPGEFRATQNWIGGASPSDARFVPPPVAQMETALAAFEKYLHAQDKLNPPLVRLGLIHYHFESIHPFVDGNGRIGRLLLSLLLVHWNLLPSPLLYLSAFFERNRQEYYDHLLAVSQKGDWENWLIFFLSGVAEQAKDAIIRARKLQDLQIGWRKLLEEHNATALSFRLANALFEYPVLTPAQVVHKYDVALPTAIQTLRRLEKYGILRESTGRTRNLQFYCDSIMEIIELK